MGIKIIQIDGGLGRVISATGAVRRFAEKNPNDQIIIMTPWTAVFWHNPRIFKLYNTDHPYIWDDIVKHGEFIHLEPYHDHLYYTQKHSLCQSFNYLLNGETDEVLPELWITADESNQGWAIRNGIQEQTGTKVFGVLQTYGASARALPDAQNTKEINDDSYRSLTMAMTERISVLESGIVYFNCSSFFVNTNQVASRQVNLRELFAVVAVSDFFLGIDSSCLHIATAFKKPGLAMLGATFRQNVSYSTMQHIQLPGYPKNYVPNRFSGAFNFNKGAMDYTIVELEQIRAFLRAQKAKFAPPPAIEPAIAATEPSQELINLLS